MDGWVRNLRDGTVEVVASGPDDALGRLEVALETGPRGSQVTKVEKTEISGMRVTKLDVSGNYSDPMMVRSGGEPIEGEARMLAAIVEAPSGSWFFKAVGPKKTITAHEQSFHKMIESVK